MTLPEFAYPDQRPDYCEGLARRILNESDRFPLAQCSDLQTRQIKWISRHDQLKNGSRPSAYVHWGVPGTIIAHQYSEAHQR
jgi:hypothetical protein